MTKVLLATMRSPFLDNDHIYPPLGTLYLQAALNQAGIESKIEDTFDYKHPEKYQEFDIWGASVTTPQRKEALHFRNIAKSLEKIAVIGGPHPSNYLEEVKAEGWDYIVVDDGERKLVNIVNGTAQPVEVDIIRTEELSKFPRPTRLQNAEMLSSYNYMLKGRMATSLITGRGCPMSCFEAKTKIILSNQQNKNIENVKIGDKLLAFNKGKIVETEVKQLVRNIESKKILRIEFENGMKIRCTEEHPFFVCNKWVLAKNLRIDNEITSIDFKDKISFFAKNNNNAKIEEVKQKISKTLKEGHKRKLYKKNGYFGRAPIEKYHSKYLYPKKWKEQLKKLSERMKKNNPMKNPIFKKKSVDTYIKRMNEGKIIPFMRTQKYWDKLQIKPNKSELLLNNILQKHFPNEWKFVGDGTVRLHYYSPDFINCNGKKKIIEFFGCYWHGCKKCNGKEINKRDLDRIKQFEILGYKTLIIYQHELKDEKKLIEKIGIFNYNGLKIKKITTINLHKYIKVFNFECFPYNNYFVTGKNKTNKYILSHNCGFCEAAQTQVRYTPFDTLSLEMDDIKQLGYCGAYIFDDLFTINRKRTAKIGQLLKERDLIFRCNGHAKFMNNDYAVELAGFGLKEIAFGAEAGSQKILDVINKKVKAQQNYDFVNAFRNLDVDVKAFLMLGLPGETHETIAETERFIAESGINDFQLAIFFPYRGTPIRENLQDYDIQIVSEGSGAYGTKGGESECNVRTSALTAKEISEARERIVRTYKPQSHRKKWKKNNEKK